MARPLRIEYPGAVYHVTSRGNAREAIFSDDVDRQGFLEIMEDVVEKYNWLCHSYCLMGNHYYGLIENSRSKYCDCIKGVITTFDSTGLFQGSLNEMSPMVV